ncbi:unnamed protein product [Calypogeia fissa]
MEKETVAQDLSKGRGMIGGVEGIREMRYLAQASGHVTLEQVKLSLMLMAGERLQGLGFEQLLPVLEGGGVHVTTIGGNRGVGELPDSERGGVRERVEVQSNGVRGEVQVPPLSDNMTNSGNRGLPRSIGGDGQVPQPGPSNTLSGRLRAGDQSRSGSERRGVQQTLVNDRGDMRENSAAGERGPESRSIPIFDAQTRLHYEDLLKENKEFQKQLKLLVETTHMTLKLQKTELPDFCQWECVKKRLTKVVGKLLLGAENFCDLFPAEGNIISAILAAFEINFEEEQDKLDLFYTAWGATKGENLRTKVMENIRNHRGEFTKLDLAMQGQRLSNFSAKV